MPRSTRKTQQFPAAADLDTAASVRALDDKQKLALAKAAADLRDKGASGDDVRTALGQGLTGPVRRELFRAAGLASGRIAKSYDQHRDGQPREGTPREFVSGSKAEAARLAREAEEEAEAQAAKATAAKKAARKAAAKKAAATRAAKA